MKNAAVYFMRLVLHDWPDNKCQQILKVLRDAAGPDSKLIVFDQIMTHACKYEGPFADVSNPIKAPSPLLANLGMGAGGFLTMIDMQVSNVAMLYDRILYSHYIKSRCWSCSMAKRELYANSSSSGTQLGGN